jgi:hypothetical protein
MEVHFSLPYLHKFFTIFYFWMLSFFKKTGRSAVAGRSNGPNGQTSVCCILGKQFGGAR